MDRLRGETTDPFANFDGLFRTANALQQDQDLVTADPPDGVLQMDALTHPGRDGRQHGVADGVAPGVVDLFEVVDIAIQNSQSRPG